MCKTIALLGVEPFLAPYLTLVREQRKFQSTRVSDAFFRDSNLEIDVCIYSSRNVFDR